MSLETIEGIYQDGTVELTERPIGVTRAKVLVTFLPTATAVSDITGTGLVYGKYSGGRVSDEDDFKIAEWCGEEVLDVS